MDDYVALAKITTFVEEELTVKVMLAALSRFSTTLSDTMNPGSLVVEPAMPKIPKVAMKMMKALQSLWQYPSTTLSNV